VCCQQLLIVKEFFLSFSHSHVEVFTNIPLSSCWSVGEVSWCLCWGMFIQNWLCRSCHVTNFYGKVLYLTCQSSRIQDISNYSSFQNNKSLSHKTRVVEIHTGERVKIMTDRPCEIWWKWISLSSRINLAVM